MGLPEIIGGKIAMVIDPTTPGIDIVLNADPLGVNRLGSPAPEAAPRRFIRHYPK